MAARKRQIDALREAFETWSSEHGLVWFDNDVALAEAIADVLDIRLAWGEDQAAGAGRPERPA